MRLVTLLFIFASFCTFAQEPAHNFVGEDDLEGLTVFSMIQDERANLWVSTSGGLFRYNGYDFKEYNSSKVISKGLFGLVQDHNQDIYCYNTTGQIFRVAGDSLQLHLTLPDTLFRNFFYIEFDNQNNLIVSGKGIHSIDEKGHITTLLKGAATIENEMVRKSDHTLQFYAANGNDLYSLKDNQVTKQGVQIPFNHPGFLYSIFTQNSEYLGVGRSSHLYKRSENTFTQVQHGIDKQSGCWMFVDQQNDIWILLNQKGLYLVSENDRMARYTDRLLFPSYTISSKLEDKDGNIWLGTFGKGLIQISNKTNQIISNASLLNNDELKSIAKDAEGNIYVGSVKGNIYKYEKDKLRIFESVPTRMDIIEFNPFANDFYSKHFVFNAKKKVYGETPYGSVKNISATHDSLVIIAAYTGLYIQDHSAKKEHRAGDFKAIGCTEDAHFGYHYNTGRVLSATYDSKNKTLWIGESSNLKTVRAIGTDEFTFHGNSVIALDMLWVHDTLYVATLKNGVLKIKNSKVIDVLDMENGLLSNTIHHIKRDKNHIYLGSNAGLQELNLITGTFENYTTVNGRQLQVKDFEILQNTAYVIHSRGIQTIRLHEKKQQVNPPILDFTSVIVGGIDKTQEKNISLNYKREYIVFHFAAKTYNNREQLIYKYRIQGEEKEWKSLPFDENTISLIGLSHGDYTIEIYAIDAQGQRSNTLLYSFSINQPFWMAWWFYLGITIAAITIVVLVFRRRLKIQQKRAEQERELNASKLTAIQSQMNPHFIFNALNSIQDLVIQGDSEKSYSFITKFANLVRRTLNYSDKDFIEFDEEIKLLELYLSLEKLRFKEDFEYTIQLDDIEGIKIPPMLIQPFIENALVHGLLHKEGLRKLDIVFELNEFLTCTIADNGIGREKARKIKVRQRSQHESFAIKAIKRRMDILRKRFGANIGFEYKDLYEGNESIGTKVVLRLPVKRRF